MAAKKLKRRSPEEKAAILAEAEQTTAVAAAKKYKLDVALIYAWRGQAKALSKKAGKPRAGKAKARRANGHAKGNAVAGLDHVHDQLSAALTSVDAMRAAFRNVFGGGA